MDSNEFVKRLKELTSTLIIVEIKYFTASLKYNFSQTTKISNLKSLIKDYLPEDVLDFEIEIVEPKIDDINKYTFLFELNSLEIVIIVKENEMTEKEKQEQLYKEEYNEYKELVIEENEYYEKANNYIETLKRNNLLINNNNNNKRQKLIDYLMNGLNINIKFKSTLMNSIYEKEEFNKESEEEEEDL